ncbi:MAG: hypothetical protein H6831_11505 [Planctomycetes bacterium]|nr:hypothetical protein [Planctomycetota bacterium]MCB9905026.1 hypothetical protein [Planctomycetota bacterium]
MQIHRIRGNDLNDALRRAKRTHGEGAVVVGHERTSDGGITLAVTVDQSAAVPAVESGAPKPARSPKPADVVRFPKAEATEPPTKRPALLEELAGRLSATGTSQEWIERVLSNVEEGTEEHPIDQVGNAIGSAFRIAKLPKAQGLTRVLALVGPTGSGKTSGLIKIGARLVRGGHPLRFASLDSRRVGAVEQLEAYAAALRVEARALPDGADLNQQSIGAAGCEVVLLDTTGRPQQDCARLVELRRNLEAEEAKVELSSFLVLPATLHRAAMQSAISQFGDLRLAGCVITKLDETPEPAHVLEYVAELGLPIAFLSDGRDLGRSLHRATPEALADLFLRGKLS